MVCGTTDGVYLPGNRWCAAGQRMVCLAQREEVAREAPSTSSPEELVKRRVFLGVFGLGAFWRPLAAGARPQKTSRVGILSPFSPASERSLLPFREALRELGHLVTFEYRWADGKPERLPELAAELVQDKVDVVL